MKATKTQHEWETFLKFYSDQYKGRKTRLGVFENTADVVNDYWLEDGLPLLGVDVEVNDLPTVEILLDSYSHSVNDVRSLKVHYTLKGDEDGMDITGSDGKTTILRFENE
ncbi:MAG: hypothetical protein AB7F88_09230 [Pyrinomonadaceae bacterium]